MNSSPPCVLFEDEHLLVINKPAGWNTHAPSPFAGEGVYDWLRQREPRWASLAIIHRLDKDTSGVIVFTKTDVANRALTEQFTARSVRKSYVLLTDRKVTRREFAVRSRLLRLGDRYVSRPAPAGLLAETRFRCLGSDAVGHIRIEAEPLTGRTHQIRVHASENGFPILGDRLYGGGTHPRLCLHARALTLKHPATGADVLFEAESDFAADPHLALREAVIEPGLTDCCRLLHGRADNQPGRYLERFGDYLLLSSGVDPNDSALAAAAQRWLKDYGSRGLYYKRLLRRPGQTNTESASPQHLAGQPAPDEFALKENGVRFLIRFHEGYSVGLFLDQRDNRRRMLTGHIAAGLEVPLGAETQILNLFAYTCAFSVCAAQAGCRTTSLDLSRKYLEWGKRNFQLNGLDPAAHDFIYGDAFDWCRRLAQKGRVFDVVLLDPPTFSRSKEQGLFRAESDYSRLVHASLPLLKRGGVLFTSTNAAAVPPEAFFKSVHAGIEKSHRRVLQEHYFPQPPDFPVSREEPAHLKTCWFRVD